MTYLANKYIIQVIDVYFKEDLFMATSKSKNNTEANQIPAVTQEIKKENEAKVITDEMKTIEINPVKKVQAEKKTAAKKEKPAAKKDKPVAKKEKPVAKKEKPAATKKSENKLTYNDIVTMTAKKVLAADISKLNDSISAQIAIYGQCDGIFYLEIKDGVISVEPWDYKGADIQIYTNTEDLVKIVTGKLSIYDAISSKVFEIYGDTEKAILLVRAAF